MKNIVKVLSLLFILGVLASCSKTDYSGTYTGYSWAGESRGVSLEEAESKIKSVMTLDKEGIIQDFSMDYLYLKNGEWLSRTDTAAEVSVDFSVEPTAANLQEGTDGTSLFTIKTNNLMSFYSVAVDEDGTVALAVVDPITRYILEAKIDSHSDLSAALSTLAIGNGLIPTLRTSGSGFTKPSDWSELEGRHLFNINDNFSYVMNKRGVYQGLTADSSIKELLQRSGVAFKDNQPLPMAPVAGFTSIGGWKGNYDAIAASLIGKNALELTGIVDFKGQSYISQKSYADGINEENFFGLNSDSVASATRTIQHSYDSVSGATVRISRENTSFQRALLDAGILEDKDVIKGRF